MLWSPSCGRFFGGFLLLFSGGASNLLCPPTPSLYQPLQVRPGLAGVSNDRQVWDLKFYCNGKPDEGFTLVSVGSTPEILSTRSPDGAENRAQIFDK